MRKPVSIDDDGYMTLDLDTNQDYIMTKWYGNSIAVFEEEAFRKYIDRISTTFRDNGNGRSVIRFFLSAAVTMIDRNPQGGWYLPEIFQRYALRRYHVKIHPEACLRLCQSVMDKTTDVPVQRSVYGLQYKF